MKRLNTANGEAMPKIQSIVGGISFKGSIAPETIPDMHPADTLSFIRRRAGGCIDWWAVEDGTNRQADFAMGVRMGREYLDFIGRHPVYGNCLLLGHIVAGMAQCLDDDGQLGASAAGFLHIVNEHAMAAATILAMPGARHVE